MKARSLFLKIFLWFWATVIATGMALVITFIFQPGNVPSQWHATLMDIARYSATTAVDQFEAQGAPAASAYIGHLEQNSHLLACLFDSSGAVISGTNCKTFADIIPRVAAADNSAFSMKYGLARVALRVQGKNGQTFIYATELPVGPRAAVGLSHAVIALRWCVALLVSGFICYLLTRYLTTPILRLREASQRLAGGDLSTRAADGMERRHDEIGSLVRDFNAMAARIEGLVTGQRQLIYDISHELRSPLARLNVALDLGRERKGDDPAFAQMERDIERLNQMIGRLLTIARLDTTATPISMTHLDLTELVSQIVQSADFESHERGGGVRLAAAGPCFVEGNAELLYSAIENVIRNAIRFNNPGETVEVRLVAVSEFNVEDANRKPMLRLIVRDHGPGVPEPELINIFQPFYRVADNRSGNGAGLGLAIADRVVHVHGGSIHARNAVPRGLEVEIRLPQSP
ncbi:HAMP domain-containing sensor histidine kinase [Alloacidobacterium sp.]|uniref:HAMP domain-containing sensor histidine kinase n=1 Tax=Alloacidobacterium sp. TaxID=2951999 RepID=UPI002D7295D6|nr:ATP-binding protein [Alloacidobacterium sp.]HYK37490.1 ATP-binding protein [Alloacidobacterium sp.]